MIVEYDGTRFSGSQYQKNVRTVQDDLENAAAKIFKNDDSTRFKLASRTDAGVHAEGQVAVIDVVTEINDMDITQAMNSQLDLDLRVRYAARVPDDFNPRSQATFREYRYIINDDRVSSPINRHMEHHVRRPVDVDAMSTVARMFVGTHDFSAFATASGNDQNASMVRRVDIASVRRRSDRRVIFVVRANAFVRQQIRRMAAVLISVGNGKINESDVREFLANPVLGAASQVAPARGLTLLKVGYGVRGNCTALPKFATENTKSAT